VRCAGSVSLAGEMGWDWGSKVTRSGTVGGSSGDRSMEAIGDAVVDEFSCCVLCKLLFPFFPLLCAPGPLNLSLLSMADLLPCR